MRKVKPEDEIPIEDLSHVAIQKRLDHYKNTTISLDLQKKLTALNTFMVKTSQSKSPTIDTRKLVKRIYKLADQLIAETVTGHHVCRKGCAHCCKIAVRVTAMEMANLHLAHGFEVQHLTETKPISMYHDYCPLLDQESGLCTVYEDRPLSCRTFFSIDTPQECEDPENSHYQFKIDGSGALSFLRNVLDQISEQSNYAAHADIREWLG